MRAAFPALLALAAFAAPAWADSHGVTIQNGTTETIRTIIISPLAGSGENRLRSTLPPGASGRITYSTGCQANVRIGYAGGRSEDHAGVDVCSDPRIVAGTDGVAGPALAQAGTSSNAKLKAAVSTNPSSPVLAPPPVVPPWTGKSIIKKFGGMD